MGGLQQITVNCEEQNIKIEKSPLSTPAEFAIRKAVRPPSGSPVTPSRGNPPAVLDSPRRRQDVPYERLGSPQATGTPQGNALP